MIRSALIAALLALTLAACDKPAPAPVVEAPAAAPAAVVAPAADAASAVVAPVTPDAAAPAAK